MFSSQLNYYHNLSPEKKWVVDMSLLSVSEFDLHQIYRLANYSLLSITQKLVKETMDECADKDIISKGNYSYSANFDFFMYVFPLMPAYPVEWRKISGYTSYYSSNFLKFIRNYLYALFHEEENIKQTEQSVLNAGSQTLPYLKALFEQEGYQSVFPLVHPGILKNAAVFKINSDISRLNPLDDILKSAALNYMSFDFFRLFFGADFNNAITHIPHGEEEPNFHFSQACHFYLKENDVEQASKTVEKGLKKQRSSYRTSQVPFEPYTALVYILILTQLDLEKNAPVFRKIIQSLEKKQYTPYDSFFLMMCEYTVFNQKKIEGRIKLIESNLFSKDESFRDIIAIIMLYFVGSRLEIRYQDKVYELVNKANDGGYLIFALETAFVLNQWWSTDRNEQLYEQIRKKAGYEPFLSRLNKQEDWEKTLNLLLGMIAPAKGKAAADSKSSARIVYEINFKNKTVQPILQKRLAKGGWSSGRNIALKTFAEKTGEGFTEQDYRVAKCLKHTADNYYYGNGYYEFLPAVFKELVGHPYLFLPASQISVELIAGEPILQVNKIKGGYRLIGNLENVDDEIILEKETNTRYKVYSLNTSQKNILETIAKQQIIIPEKGKEKLSKVLGNFSSQITVHSDIVEAGEQTAKTVKADERIRVQLLPAGNGLKAELFCKPFGEHPPYCKPGVGGKILISNQNGERKQVSRNLKKETEWADKLISEIQSLENIDANEDLISFEDPQDCLFLLEILEKYKDIAVVEWPEGERYKIKKSIDFKDINLKIENVNNWFELQGDVRINEKTVLSIQQLLALSAKSKNRFVELNEGEFIALSRQLKKQLDELHSLTETGKKGVRINKFASVSAADFFDEIENLKSDKAWKEFQEKLETVQKEQLAIPAGLQAELRPYQEEGFRWMARLAEWEAGGCLADDMGLGKTIQSLAILLHRVSQGAALVIAPVSVIPNWISETKKFAPTLNIKTLSNVNRKEMIDSLEPGDVLITSYGLMQSEIDLLKERNWATIILDEAHTIKNRDTKTSQAAMSLNASFKLALTGTPIQNHLGEIWNLFNFINHGMLGSLQHFNDTFVKPEGQGQKYLKKLITPFILRRTKTAVLDELPPKTEIIKKIELSAEEMAFYEALRRQAVANIESDENNNGAKHIKALAEITRLRQACCNTALVNSGQVKLPSAKLAVFLQIVSELKANNHRALVFSQFVSHLSLVRQELDKQGVSYQYLDGSTTLPEREKQVKQFQSGQADLFLISLKAGGLGLNLTSADFVIHLDPWWNPAVEDQASDRAHRIGQVRPVTVYRLVAENTIEEKIIHLHHTKRDLADSLLEGSDQSGKLSTKELLELIRNN